MGGTFADANAGIWTWSLADGKWSYEVKSDGELPPGYAVTYCEATPTCTVVGSTSPP
jgi:hypothetical protein